MTLHRISKTVKDLFTPTNRKYLLTPCLTRNSHPTLNNVTEAIDNLHPLLDFLPFTNSSPNSRESDIKPALELVRRATEEYSGRKKGKRMREGESGVEGGGRIGLMWRVSWDRNVGFVIST